MYIHRFAILFLFQSLVACNQESEIVQSSPASLACESKGTSCQAVEKTPTAAVNIVFQTTNAGQTWQDISQGLPGDLKIEGFFANNSELYLRTEGGMYHGSASSTPPLWEKELSLDERCTNVLPSRAGQFAYSDEGKFYQKANGLNFWLPMYTNFPSKQMVRTFYETRGGAVLIGCDNGLFKSDDEGNTWKHVFNNGWVLKIVEADGVLIATNEQGIMRSTDGGEHWDVVVSEGGVGIAAECIEGGFAVITYNTESKTRRIRRSIDGGKTWQLIDAGLPPSDSVASIKQSGKYLFCGHPKGIFRSSDAGKTWELILPSIDEKVFNLSVSGNVMYAVPRNAGC